MLARMLLEICIFFGFFPFDIIGLDNNFEYIWLKFGVVWTSSDGSIC